MSTEPLPTRPAPALSMFDPVFFGVDEHGVPVTVRLVYRNLLAGAEPGGGKSVLLNNIVAHAALCTDVQLWLFDGKQVELGLWAPVAEVFVGTDVADAVDQLAALQAEMDRRYQQLTARRRRKVVPGDGVAVVLCVVDEIAYYSATAGDKRTQEAFAVLLRDLVARGRAVGLIVVAA